MSLLLLAAVHRIVLEELLKAITFAAELHDSLADRPARRIWCYGHKLAAKEVH